MHRWCRGKILAYNHRELGSGLLEEKFEKDYVVVTGLASPTGWELGVGFGGDCINLRIKPFG